MRQCPKCGGDMVRWGNGRFERWRCPACHQKRRKQRHRHIEGEFGAPRQEIPEPKVVIEDSDLTLYNGDCLDVLCALPDKSVDMVATSPPFWSMRDYQADGQIGIENTVEEWVAQLCDVFDECRRVMADHATCWVEIGDSFDNKQLVGQPWRLAFALQERGWYLRSEIIWARLRPNPMPESVTDRPTKSHSTVFLLSKSPRYFFDHEAIKSPHQHDGRKVTQVVGRENSAQHRNGERWPGGGANARSVWTIATEPTPFAHFATFPRELVRRMILAGCPERGTVLDPFAGSGTTLLVARSLGRHSIGIELNEKYCRLAAERTQQLSLLA